MTHSTKLLQKFDGQQFISNRGKVFYLRHFCLEDLEQMQIFFKKGSDETTHTLLCKEKETPMKRLHEQIVNAMKSSSELYLGVFDDCKIVASLQFRGSIPGHPWVKHIGEFGMLVLQEYWGQGIGTKLIEIMEDFAVSIGVTRIESKVRLNNERGIALYQKRGFNIEGIRKHAAFISCKFEDEYFIAKLLNTKHFEEVHELLFKEVSYKDEDFAIALRPIEEKDADQVHDAVMRSLNLLHPFMDWSHRELSVNGQIQRIREAKEETTKKRAYDFSVFDYGTDEFLASASLQPSRVPNKKCYGIGYWVATDHCNRGLATLATKILVVIAFEFLECDRVEIACNKANIPSQRVIEKCGFQYEGEAKNYFPEPTSAMLEKGHSSERTGLQFALVKNHPIPWFDEIKNRIVKK